MSLSQVRAYFRSVATTTDTDLREWNDAFNIENIPSTLFDKSYHVDYGTVNSTVKTDAHITDTFNVTVRIFKKGYRTPQEGLDEVMDLAHNYRLNAIKFPGNQGGDNRKDVNCLALTPVFPDTNDNLIFVEMEFEVTLIFSAI